MNRTAMSIREFRFALDISSERYLSYYQGIARHVQVRTLDGRSIRFPADILRRVVTRDGVRGEFVLEVDEHNRFNAIRKVRDL